MKGIQYIIMSIFLLTINKPNAGDIAPQQIPGAITVSTATAKILFDKRYVFVDVRKSEDFNHEHIPGARHLSVNSEQFTPGNLQAIVKKDEALIFYCNGISCPGSAKASQKAVEWGWRNIFYYREGIPGWKEAGFTVEGVEK